MTQFTNRVMRRVYTMYLLKRIINPVAMRMYVLAAGLGLAASFIHVSSVMNNLTSITNASSLWTFSSTAFMHTELTTQLVLLVVALAATLLVRDTITSLQSGFGFARQLEQL